MSFIRVSQHLRKPGSFATDFKVLRLYICVICPTRILHCKVNVWQEQFSLNTRSVNRENKDNLQYRTMGSKTNLLSFLNLFSSESCKHIQTQKKENKHNLYHRAMRNKTNSSCHRLNSRNSMTTLIKFSEFI